jgi:hypothetical protein
MRGDFLKSKSKHLTDTYTHMAKGFLCVCVYNYIQSFVPIVEREKEILSIFRKMQYY